MCALWLQHHQQRATSEVTAMADFDVSQALDMGSVEQLPDSYSCCVDDTEDTNFPFDMELVITYNHKTVQRVANLVMTINKMRKPVTRLGQELSDQQLSNAVLEDLIEDTTVEMLKSHGKKGKFLRAKSELSCTLCDEAQKDVTHNSDMLTLHAITLKGGNNEKKVIFQMTRYIECTSAKQSVILSIKNSNHYLTCSMQGETAVLALEHCSEADLQNFNSGQIMDRFLFYKTISSMSLTKFESVNCKGWFISTSSEDENQPVEMCQMDNAARYTCFNIVQTNESE